ncbi:hypothetical protein DFA_06719 [Cavenderia fasciculata]|uniref:CHAT domain-containing protein n=1 Tax=Cavenderia fasciculata TaxID=261658 RepID=F4Q232_CACFS|nr:uncharacterized protein DFA_06719 [Cavenderia fasciculata]EGG18052.1 hypothetical protein DFA_06719 [Cavenderia fasciculata]|eukprot:XP_004356945.1 hypothetical protein DFA_06719 [Cavenderia fasciculata]
MIITFFPELEYCQLMLGQKIEALLSFDERRSMTMCRTLTNRFDLNTKDNNNNKLLLSLDEMQKLSSTTNSTFIVYVADHCYVIANEKINIKQLPKIKFKIISNFTRKFVTVPQNSNNVDNVEKSPSSSASGGGRSSLSLNNTMNEPRAGPDEIQAIEIAKCATSFGKTLETERVAEISKVNNNCNNNNNNNLSQLQHNNNNNIDNSYNNNNNNNRPNVLLVGNPYTSDKEKKLTSAQVEVNMCEQLFQQSEYTCHKLIGPEATLPNVLDILENTILRYIHFAVHGGSNGKKGSTLFKGSLTLAEREDGKPAKLYAEDIIQLVNGIQSDTVFLSCCHSGKGNNKQQGLIGLVWSFHCAGALSVVASHWELPDTPLTFDQL